MSLPSTNHHMAVDRQDLTTVRIPFFSFGKDFTIKIVRISDF